jgi:hypothetical protein
MIAFHKYGIPFPEDGTFFFCLQNHFTGADVYQHVVSNHFFAEFVLFYVATEKGIHVIVNNRIRLSIHEARFFCKLREFIFNGQIIKRVCLLYSKGLNRFAVSF